MIKAETLRSLEFDRILKAVGGYANCEATEEAVAELRPLEQRQEIEMRFGRVEEIRQLRQIGVSLPLSQFSEIRLILEAVRPEGAVLDPRDLVLMVPALRVMAAVKRQFAYREDIPLLKEVAGAVTGFSDILEPLENSLDGEGNILDTASKLLKELRTQKKGLTARIRKRLEEIVREKRTAIFLQDDFITQRAGRWVIPVRMDSKGMVAGVVHDVSNSGETAFMEPLEIIGLANELENLTADEKGEMIRILREICNWIREDAEQVEIQFRAIIQLDLLNSIAGFADLLEAERPGINETGEIRLSGARHPLLMLLRRERGGRPIEPLDLALGETQEKVMIITGPNAGGKTIALKTTGLLLLMGLTGIPIPAASTSTLPLAGELLVDIGDDQSIEASLSTFSAHVSNIAAILGRADQRTVCLLDELGTGTEPGQGAAIACSVLHHLHQKGALVIATTHLTDIIGFVHKTSGMVNAAMEFDLASLTPLYRLKTGEPGQSHAIEIARRYGLPEEVIEFACGMISRLESDFHELLSELKEDRRKYEYKLADLEGRSRECADRERLLAERFEAAELHRRETMQKSWQEAKEVIQGAKREVNAIIEEARAEKTKAARERLAVVEKGIEEQLRGFRPDKKLALDTIIEGGTVFVIPIGYDATVISIDKKQERVRVRAGLLEMEIPLSDLALPEGKKVTPRKPTRPVEEVETVGRLNMVGFRVDDAIAELERFLNHAALDGLSQVTVIHGKGTGALMRSVREYISIHPLVAEFRKGEPFEGGEGVTLVTIR